MLQNYLIRQEIEDEMEKLLAKAGADGARSDMVLPPRNELEGELKVQIKEGDYAGVLIIRPKAVRNETEDVATGLVGPYYSPPAGNENFWTGTWPWDRSTRPLPTLKENTYVSTEFNLYNIGNERTALERQTEPVGKMAKQYAKTLVQQLKKDKVIAANNDDRQLAISMLIVERPALRHPG